MSERGKLTKSLCVEVGSTGRMGDWFACDPPGEGCQSHCFVGVALRAGNRCEVVCGSGCLVGIVTAGIDMWRSFWRDFRGARGQWPDEESSHR